MNFHPKITYGWNLFSKLGELLQERSLTTFTLCNPYSSFAVHKQ